jgi:putative transposase
VRGVAGGEMRLPVWEAFAGEDPQCRHILTSMLAGVSTRNYETTLEPVGATLETSSTSKSAVSRRFVTRTSVALGLLMVKDLSDLSICVLYADGICEADHTMVCAIGIDTQGNKHLLGLREGSSENKAVCSALLAELVGRGLDFSGGILCVIDGGKRPAGCGQGGLRRPRADPALPNSQAA